MTTTKPSRLSKEREAALREYLFPVFWNNEDCNNMRLLFAEIDALRAELAHAQAQLANVRGLVHGDEP